MVSSTQEVLPPINDCSGSAVGIDPRTPQNRNRCAALFADLLIISLLRQADRKFVVFPEALAENFTKYYIKYGL